MSSAKIIQIDPKDPDLAKVRDVARASREGKIVVFPTEAVYSMGAPMSLPGVFERLTALKANEKESLSIFIGEWEMIDYLQIERTAAFRYLTREFWPGPLTLIVKNRDGSKVSLRFPKHILATALINQTGEAFIAATASAKKSQAPKTIEQVRCEFDESIEFMIDGGPTEFGEEPTIVDITDEKNPKVIHKAAQGDEIQKAVEKIKSGNFFRKKILVVCTGNSCRSPMAEGWLRDEFERLNLTDQIEVSSCGVGARGGMTATPEAVLVMKNREIDITSHRSQSCSREDVMNSDLILAMGQQHYVFITGMVPMAKPKIKVLNILDPIGMSLPVYENVMNEIEKKIKAFWNEVIN
jgi:tRNA threonylcarbamoyl adenosine modification protein (Sua5/YciO/YrdC/YwlC family)